jgi:hypothetical protein
MKFALGLFLSIALFIGCKENSINNSVVFNHSDLNKANRNLLEISMEDGFPPPVASRVYVYPHIANYITLQQFYPDSLSDISKSLNGLEAIPQFSKENVNAELAGLLAFCKVAKKVIFSEHYMESLIDSFKIEGANRGLSEKVILNTEVFADSISMHLIKWLAKDNYIETRTMERFTSVKHPSKWQETPPDYQQALEPNWLKIRTLVIDSLNIYKAAPLPEYSTDKNSDFYKMALNVYNVSKQVDSTKINISWFWDDNPNTSDHTGHSVAIIHKIAPPGHWLNIIHQISEKEEYSLFKTSNAYTKTAIAMFDGIIACWHIKFETNLVRPITYIQENIDVNWKTIIQTPPFPEYTSGHSVLSAAAATVLTEVFGDNFVFEDNTTELFGMPRKTFTSFQDAAWEVSMSRLYGGIHYYEGILEGNKQGKFIGSYVINKLNK